MITGLSNVIAHILTALVLLLLYPVKFFFWCLGRLGNVVCVISDWIVEHANKAIDKLVSELKSSQN